LFIYPILSFGDKFAASSKQVIDSTHFSAFSQLFAALLKYFNASFLSFPPPSYIKPMFEYSGRFFITIC